MNYISGVYNSVVIILVLRPQTNMTSLLIRLIVPKFIN